MMRQTASTGAHRETSSRGYRNYVLFLLIALYTSNFIDRTILSTLGQPIKAELKLSDAQLGVLGGFAFAILYSTLGLPVARLAERHRRVSVIAGALAVWSGMTALCGLAQTYPQLLLARIGVGVGEAGCIPPANSLIADYFPPDKRATAAGLFSLGIPLGALIGALLAAWTAQHYGWRAAFMLVGLPGLALAVLVKLTIREPARGVYDPAAATTKAPPFTAVVRTLAAKPAFLHMAFGASLSSFAGYGISQFAIPFLIRGYHVTLMQGALVFGLIGGLSAAVGVGGGGFLTDWAGRRDKRLYVLIPAAGFLVAGPLYIAAFLQRGLAATAGLIVVPSILQYLYLGPLFALTQNMVEPRMRATAAAILTLIINLIGYGLGPMLIGWASDQYAAQAFAGAGRYLGACPGGLPPHGASPTLAASCAHASFLGLQRALVTASAVYAWAGLHFWLAARTLRRDLEA